MHGQCEWLREDLWDEGSEKKLTWTRGVGKQTVGNKKENSLMRIKEERWSGEKKNSTRGVNE